MVSMKKPLRILELGTAIGYSAVIMHEAAGTNPHITTIERSEEMIKYAKENIKVVRIKSSDIKRESNNLISWLTSYKEELSNSEIINQYKETLSLKNTDVRVMYDAVMRLQMVLLSEVLLSKLLKNTGIMLYTIMEYSYAPQTHTKKL